jgi:hypothetical protein
MFWGDEIIEIYSNFLKFLEKSIRGYILEARILKENTTKYKSCRVEIC